MYCFVINWIKKVKTEKKKKKRKKEKKKIIGNTIVKVTFIQHWLHIIILKYYGIRIIRLMKMKSITACGLANNVTNSGSNMSLSL